MAWSAPMTAVANSVFTAAQYNTYVRDNLLETEPAKATAAGRLIQGAGANSLVERTISSQIVRTSEQTTSTTYTDLLTVGPTVTLTTGTSALVWISCRANSNTAPQAGVISYAVSGATSVSASDTWATRMAVTPSNNNRAGICNLHTGLTAGSNTFTMKYKVSGTSNGTFDHRTLVVMAL